MINPRILSHFKGKAVLITGGTGMIGRQIVDLLAEAGACIQDLSRKRMRHGTNHSAEDWVNMSL